MDCLASNARTHGRRPVMIEERVGAQYQNWYDRSSVMPSATSLSAFGVIMSGLCQPTLCQPKSCGTRACNKHPATESAWQQAARCRSRTVVSMCTSHTSTTTSRMCGLEPKSGIPLASTSMASVERTVAAAIMVKSFSADPRRRGRQLAAREADGRAVQQSSLVV